MKSHRETRWFKSVRLVGWLFVYLIFGLVSGTTANAEPIKDSVPQLVRLTHPQTITIVAAQWQGRNGRIDIDLTCAPDGTPDNVILKGSTGTQELDALIVAHIRMWQIDLKDIGEQTFIQTWVEYRVQAPPTVTVYSRANKREFIDADRSVSSIRQKKMTERLVKSTPEALTFSTGVFVQRTAHGQASPYIRGRTGQQTLFLVDGIRLNHALFRKGPNQYLFTVDPNSLDGIDVIRGSASVDYGSDAIGGAVLLHTKKPVLDPTNNEGSTRIKMFGQTHSADDSVEGRVEVNHQFDRAWALKVGLGGKNSERLEAGGRSQQPRNERAAFCDEIDSVPCFEADGRTQLGTGYQQFTHDLMLRNVDAQRDTTISALLYRQYDAPRTDQCPPPEAAISDCLTIDEQARSQLHLQSSHRSPLGLLARIDYAIGFQRQAQDYTRARPDRVPSDGIDTGTFNVGHDAIDAWSGFVKGKTHSLELKDLRLHLKLGIDYSHESVRSESAIRFNQPNMTIALPRGNYIEGSTYASGGAFTSLSVAYDQLIVRTGVRQSHFSAYSPGEIESSSAKINRSFQPRVWNAGVSFGGAIQAFAHLEAGFRAPNLDDLTARQYTGQGYQLDNPNLKPESALTREIGVRIRTPKLQFNVVAFDQSLEDAIERQLISPQACRLSETYTDRACGANRAPVQLVNLTQRANIHGLELELKARPTKYLSLFLGGSYTYGQGAHPNPEIDEEIPLSRIPPMNGFGEVTYRQNRFGMTIAHRWALPQNRLSIGDIADARIPAGGTPGFSVVDLRVNWRVKPIEIHLLLENLLDERYRYHGSSVFGAGRSIGLRLGYSN